MNHQEKDRKPECFGLLDVVFPKGTDGTRVSPDHCRLACAWNTLCMQEALRREAGTMASEKVDQRYAAGKMGFAERWSRRKALARNKSASRAGTK